MSIADDVEYTTSDVEERLEKASKASRVVSVILFIVTGLWLAVTLFGAAVLLVGYYMPNNTFVTMTGDVFYSFIIAAIGLLLSSVFAVVGLIFHDIGAGESPFSEKQVSRLRAIALLLILYVIVDAFQSGNADALLRMGDFQFHVSFTERPLVKINIGMLMGSLISFCMSFVFQYGLLLQSVSDDVV